MNGKRKYVIINKTGKKVNGSGSTPERGNSCYALGKELGRGLFPGFARTVLKDAGGTGGTGAGGGSCGGRAAAAGPWAAPKYGSAATPGRGTHTTGSGIPLKEFCTVFAQLKQLTIVD